MSPRRVRRHIRATVLIALAIVAAACGPAVPPTEAPTSAIVSVSTVGPTSSPAPTPVPAAIPSATPSPAPGPSPTPASALVPADLDGILVAPELAHRLPLAIMLDDSRAARPQSGFNAASIVYQAPADGYETRYMLVFQEGDADVGPVRSARFYLAQWASEVRAALAHYGGDQRTRRHIRYNPQMFTDVDGIGRSNSAYHRIKTRRSPHDAYGTTVSIRRVALKFGAPEVMSDGLHRRPFVDPAPTADRALSQRIRIPYRTNIITYRYDPVGNRYLRSIDGGRQVDPADSQQVSATNVIVLFQRFRIDTRIEPGHSRPDIKTLGKGKALVFREGRVVRATWKKAGDTAPTLIVDADGNEIPLVRGRTFIQVVPPGTAIKIAP